VVCGSDGGGGWEWMGGVEWWEMIEGVCEW